MFSCFIVYSIIYVIAYCKCCQRKIYGRKSTKQKFRPGAGCLAGAGIRYPRKAEKLVYDGFYDCYRLASLLLFYSYFLFAVIIIVGSVVVILNDGRNPGLIDFAITTEGIIIGRNFYDYDEIKNFSIVYKPNQDTKKLYFEFKNPMKMRLSIALINMNPLPIRENLLKYLPEDLERTDQPLSENLARIFKL